jgi:hypothetical protein
MITVSDTTPLHYLILVGKETMVPVLFDRPSAQNLPDAILVSTAIPSNGLYPERRSLSAYRAAEPHPKLAQSPGRFGYLTTGNTTELAFAPPNQMRCVAFR